MTGPGGPSGAGGSGSSPASPPRDVKKLFLVVGLGTLSWVATYVGMLELVEANMGDLPIVHKLIIGFSVAMLMTMIIWLLDRLFQPIGALTRLAYVSGYLFLTLISVGFSFGFYWKVLESRSESSRSAESAVGQVQASLHAASTRLEQLNATLTQLATVSLEKAELERAKGTSCPNSKPGDGPRRKMREDDAARFSFASDFVKGRVASVNAEMAALNGDLARIAAKDPTLIDPKSGTRNEFMKALGRKLDMTATGFNAFRTDPQLRQLHTDLSDRAEKVTFGDPKNGGFVCPDVQLQQALRGATRAIDQLPELEKPEIAAVEGSEATIEAFRRLTATLYGLMSFKMPPSADELRELQQKAVHSVEGGASAKAIPSVESAGLSKRDYVPLGIAIFVDLCLFLVSIGRPVNRLHGLMPKMREAEIGPVSEILSRFKDIHRDPEVRESFELFRHVVFDINGDYYVAVPLDAPTRMNPQQREALRVEAQLLNNLFASFEKEKIFTRTWMPLTGRVKSKLRRQGSKFAESDAFRVYRFRKGAWSEIILGAVMGAARRAEDARRAAGLDPVTGNPARMAGLDAGAGSMSRSQVTGSQFREIHRPGDVTQTTRRGTASEWNSESRRRPAPVGAQDRITDRPGSGGATAPADVSAAYGRYARYNPPHPRSASVNPDASRRARADDATSALQPANGNTAPAARSASSLRAVDAAPAGEAFVAFQGGEHSAAPRRPSAGEAAPSDPHVERQFQADAAVMARSGDTIVVLRRETATVSLPTSDVLASNDVIGRLGQALASSADSDGQFEAATAALPQHEIITSVQPALIDHVPGPAAESAIHDITVDAPDLAQSDEYAGAVSIAARLRPNRTGDNS